MATTLLEPTMATTLLAFREACFEALIRLTLKICQGERVDRKATVITQHIEQDIQMSNNRAVVF